MMFALSDEAQLIISIVGMVLGALATAFTGYLGYLTQSLNRKVESVAQTGDLTYGLANSAMLAQKLETAVTKRALADTDPNNKVYAASARIAEETYRQHLAQHEATTAQTKNANEARRDANFQTPPAPPIVSVVQPPEM